ncbi:MAG: hypothetical protein GF364_16920 [Candidatus Lokiarchaeota archaeon]|nr:hypothetical protein [Candidatus Lokiarchaeota archaeon]
MSKMEEEKLSWGQVIDKEDLNQINLPKSMIESYIKKTQKKHVLIVFTPRENILKIDVFPIENKDIIKVQLKLTQFSGSTVKQIAHIIRELNIPKNLFTSGVCIQSDMCLYEAYIEYHKLGVSLDDLKERFTDVENVTEVNIIKIK